MINPKMRSSAMTSLLLMTAIFSLFQRAVGVLESPSPPPMGSGSEEEEWKRIAKGVLHPQV
jgi:hypothetical protein